MSIPSKVVGAGNGSSAQNVYKVTFSQALSAIPTLESWDDSSFSSVTREQFVGTAVNGGIPYISAVATTDAAPSASWKPAAAVAGGATINRLKGLVNVVNLSVAIPTAGGTVRFNLDWEIPSDAAVPATNSFGVLAIRFSFSGATPSLTWQFNDSVAGGTEGAPSFTSLTAGASGNFIRPADTGSSSANVVLTKPTSSVQSAGEQWVTNT